MGAESRTSRSTISVNWPHTHDTYDGASFPTKPGTVYRTSLVISNTVDSGLTAVVLHLSGEDRPGLMYDDGPEPKSTFPKLCASMGRVPFLGMCSGHLMWVISGLARRKSRCYSCTGLTG